MFALFQKPTLFIEAGLYTAILLPCKKSNCRFNKHAYNCHIMIRKPQPYAHA